MAQDGYSIVVFGCGNSIMGDDGFGPAVIDKLNSEHILPDYVCAVDAGTAVREYLLDYLLMEEGRPEVIIILDAVDFEEKEPGEVFCIEPASIPEKKIHDFSLHQFPTVNLLQELVTNTGISVKIIAAQVECIPKEIAPGLSQRMTKAVENASHEVLQICRYS